MREYWVNASGKPVAKMVLVSGKYSMIITFRGSVTWKGISNISKCGRRLCCFYCCESVLGVTHICKTCNILMLVRPTAGYWGTPIFLALFVPSLSRDINPLCGVIVVRDLTHCVYFQDMKQLFTDPAFNFKSNEATSLLLYSWLSTEIHIVILLTDPGLMRLSIVPATQA